MISPTEAFNRFGKIGATGPALELLNENLRQFPNIEKARSLDLTAYGSFEAYEASNWGLVHGGNVLHICPPAGSEGFFRFASHVLKPQGIATLYGPFKRHGSFTTTSNAEFDAMLKQKNLDFGLRDVESNIIPSAEKCGLRMEEIHEMPANNFFIIFSKL
jgi:hypothetical protein